MTNSEFHPFVYRNKTADSLWSSKALVRHAQVVGRTPEMATVLRAMAERHAGLVTLVLTTADPVVRANSCAVVDELERWLILLDPRFAPRIGGQDEVAS